MSVKFLRIKSNNRVHNPAPGLVETLAVYCPRHWSLVHVAYTLVKVKYDKKFSDSVAPDTFPVLITHYG